MPLLHFISVQNIEKQEGRIYKTRGLLFLGYMQFNQEAKIVLYPLANVDEHEKLSVLRLHHSS